MSDIARTLDYYLADISNHTLQQDLELVGCPDILGFFHRFYQWVDLVKQGLPSEAIKGIEALDLPGGVTVLIVYHLREKFHHFHFPEMPEPESGAPPGSVMYLDGEYERLKTLYPPDIYAQDDPSDISRLARQSLFGHYIIEDVLTSVMKRAIAEGEKEAAIEMAARQSERERMEASIGEIVQAALAAAGVKRNPEHTLNRQVLALGFLLRHLGVKVEKSSQARFIEFLTSKTYKDIYDNLRELEDRVYHREGKDAEFVIEKFKELGLYEIAKEIEELINRPHEKL